ncbi:MAG: hypothetical protein ACE5EK_10260, partial [Nitrospinales bacterium]
HNRKFLLLNRPTFGGKVRPNKEERVTFGINYRSVEAFVFKVEYQINNSKNEVLERGGNNGVVASVSAVF